MAVIALGAPSLLRNRRYCAPNPSAHVHSDLADDGLGHEHINAIDARQIHSRDALQFIGKIEVRLILVLFLLLFWRQVFVR